MQGFEWDDEKAASNLEKHGIDFADVAGMVFGLAYNAQSPRGGEMRVTSIGPVQGRLITLVWTPRRGAIRIISARRSSQSEERTYYQAIGSAAGDRQN